MSQLLHGALLLLLLRVGVAQEALPGPQKYLLVESGAAGDVSEEEWRSSTNAKLLYLVSGSQIEATISERSEEKYRAETLAGGGNEQASHVRRTYSRKRETSRRPGSAEQQKVSSIEGKTIEIRRRDGKVSVTVLHGKISAADRRELEAPREENPPSFFPAHAVAVGDEWGPDPDVARNFIGDSTVEKADLKCRLEEIVQHSGHQCARIRFTVMITGQMKPPLGPATMKLSGDLYHSIEHQRTVAIDVRGTMTLEGEFPNETRESIPMKGEGQMRWRSRTRWLKVAGKPVKTTPPAVGSRKR